MKQLLVYVNPRKYLDENEESLVKIQIDNSLELGWKAEDIMLATNFEYAYKGVKSTILSDDTYCDYSPISTKIPALLSIIDSLEGMWWMHDLDAFQLSPITDEEIGTPEYALCDYGRMPRWEGGNIFFRKEAKDIFEKEKEIMDAKKTVDEGALWILTNENESIRARVTKLNITYSFKSANVNSCYKIALKPLRIAHFNPREGIPKNNIPNLLDFYKGKNKIHLQLIPDRLIRLFDAYNIK